MVLAVCRRLLTDTAEAEDAMQQTFVSAYRSLLSGSEPRQGHVWLAAIARNECLDRIRMHMREPQAEHGRNGRSEAPDALAALIAGEDLRDLSRSIETLPTQQREALLLHEFCGLPYEEVAATLGVSESAIGSLLFRARKSLRSALRRAYALLPLPQLWNAADQLFSGAPALKVAALPVIVKFGAGAVAVGLTAGAVVAVEHEVGKPGQASRPGRVVISGAPAPLPEAKALASVVRPVPATPMHRTSAVAATAVAAPSRRPSHASRTSHRTPAAPTERTVHAAPEPAPLEVTAPAASTAQGPPVGHSASQEPGRSGSAPGHVRSASAAIHRGRVGKSHAWGRPTAKTPSLKQKPPRPGSNRGVTHPAKPVTASPAAAPPGQSDDPTTQDASTPPSESGSDTSKDHPEHPEHPDHPEHPVKT